jgi:glycosyltransferase involved in cell wall biosynthesis
MARSHVPTVHVAIDTGTDPAEHGRAHRAGTAAEPLPYGLAHLRDHGFEVTFLPRRRAGLATRVAAEAGRRATLDLNPWSLAEGARARRRADVVLAWEERVGLPVAAARRLGEPPCVTGVIWLTDRRAAAPRAWQRAVRTALRQCAAVFVLSSAQVAPLVEEWGVAPGRVHRIAFGVPVDFWGKGGPVASQPGLVVSAGNDWDRDHELTVRAVNEVRRRLPVRLELLTERPVPVPDAVGVRRRAGGAGEVRAAYHRAAFVVVSTRHNLHASGMTVALEAMAAGRAVVMSATPGMEDYVTDGVTGFLVPPGDLDALVARVETLAGDPPLAARMGAAGQAHVAARHDRARMVADLSGLLHAARGR